MTRYFYVCPHWGKWDRIDEIWLDGTRVDVQGSSSTGELHGVLIASDAEGTVSAKEIRGQDEVPAEALPSGGR